MYTANTYSGDCVEFWYITVHEKKEEKKIESTDFVFNWISSTTSLDWLWLVVTTKHQCKTFCIGPQERGHKRQNTKSQQRLSVGKDYATRTYCWSTEPYQFLHTVYLSVLQTPTVKNMLQIHNTAAFVCHSWNLSPVKRKCISQGFIDEILSIQIEKPNCFLSLFEYKMVFHQTRCSSSTTQHWLHYLYVRAAERALCKNCMWKKKDKREWKTQKKFYPILNF